MGMAAPAMNGLSGAKSDMLITMGVPTFLPHDRATELSWYRGIDEGPWNGLAVSDGITFPNGWALTVQLAAAAAVTERVKLSTAIAAVTLRNPVLFAKEMATVDLLSGGRLTLGIGIGSQEEDYAVTGVDISQRHQRMDDDVAIMQKMWRHEPIVEGHYPVGPKLPRAGGIPLLAGAAEPKALARAARWASGVIDAGSTIALDAEGLASQKQRVVEAWEGAGRPDRPYFAAFMYFAAGPDSQAQLGDYIAHISHSHGAEQAAQAAAYASNYGPSFLNQAVAAAREAGVDELILAPTTADVRELDRTRDALGI